MGRLELGNEGVDRFMDDGGKGRGRAPSRVKMVCVFSSSVLMGGKENTGL